VLLAAKAAIGAGLAWWVAGAADGSVTPYFAPLGVLLVVQPTVYDSLSRAVQRVVGVTVGVIAALVVSHFVGLSGWSIAGFAFVGMLLGWILRLGPQGVVQIPVSALLVLVVGSTTPGYAWARIVDTLIGVGIGAAAVLLSPSAPSREALVAAATEPLAGLAGVLREAGTGIAGTWTRAEAEKWFADASGVVDAVMEQRRRTESQKVGARWNARAPQFLPALTRAEEALATARRMAIQVRGMTRGMTEGSAQAPSLPRLGALLTSLAEAVDAYAAWVGSGGQYRERQALSDALDRSEDALKVSLDRVRSSWRDDIDRWMAFGLILAGTQRIVAELNGELDREPSEPE
jgi:uncharacterized membrane protein YccC